MKNYEGSLDRLLTKIFELEARGQIGRHVVDRLVLKAKGARDNGCQIGKGKRVFSDEVGVSGFVVLAKGLTACGLITQPQCDEFVRLVSNTMTEGSQATRAGNEPKASRVKRPETGIKQFKLPGHLHPATPLVVLQDLGLPKRLYNALMREGWRTVADVPTAEVLMEIRNIGYENAAAIRGVLIDNGYAA